MIQVREGAYYVTRDKRVAGPAIPQPHSEDWPWHIAGFGSYTDSGRFNGEFDDGKDLIEEWRLTEAFPDRQRQACVYTFNHVTADYECVAVFTKVEDAEAWVRLREPVAPVPPQQTRFPIVGRTFGEMVDEMVRYRLGRIADILYGKETEARRPKTAGELAELRSATSPVPAHVTETS